MTYAPIYSNTVFVMGVLCLISRWALFLAAAVLCIAAGIDGNGVRADYLFIGVPVLVVLYGLFLFLSRGDPSRQWRLAEWVFWISAFLLLPWLALYLYFGPYSMNAVFFHMQEGLGGNFPMKARFAIAAAVVVVLVSLHGIYTILRRLPFSALMLWAIALAFLAVNPLHRQLADGYAPVLAGEYSPLYPKLANPVITLVPENPLNLVVIYLEGLEATYGEGEAFEDVYAPLERLKGRSLVFDRVGQMAMTGWSIAGLVASQCGLPLVPRGFFQRNSLGGIGRFMPTRVCLGDILKGQAYRQHFFVGADAEFGGLRDFVLAHGFDRLTDLDELRGRDPDDLHEWGAHDEVLFDAAMEEIVRLETASAPYFVAIETIGPHGPQGSLSRSCRAPGQGGETDDILQSVACTAGLAADFVERLEQVVDMDKTLLVVLSDHLAHPFVPVSRELERFERYNTLFAMGAGIEPGVVSKPGTMIDVYPTILSLLGFGLRRDHAGMGASLLAERPGLASGQDPDRLARRIRNDMELARRIWAPAAVPDDNGGRYR